MIASVSAGAPVLAGAADTQNLASGCSGCHGLAGNGYDSLPAIAGRSPDEFMQSMLDFKADRRQDTVMNRIAKGFSDEELMRLARHFAERH